MTPANPDALADARELIRQTLKVGAPGLSEAAREAVVRSIMLKLKGKGLLFACDHPPASAPNELRDAAGAVLRACIADMEFGLPDALHDDEPVRETLFGEWKSALRVGDLRRLQAAICGVPRWPSADELSAAAEARAAQLQAEVEAKDRAILLLLPFVDYAAGEGLMFVETEDGEHPEMDAADIMAAVAEALGLELGSDAYLSLLPKGYFAIRTALAARAATAREG